MHSPARDPYYHLINGCQLAADRQSRRSRSVASAALVGLVLVGALC
jgi:hypothetical protein